MEERFRQIRMAPSDRHRTEFRTCMGQYEFKLMPFGQRGAPGAFQAVVTHMCFPFIGKGVIAYLDDELLVHGPEEQTYAALLRNVLSNVDEHKMYAKISRCQFGSSSIEYLGYTVPDPTKPYVPRTDAPGYAMGAIVEEDDKALGLMSKRMTDADMRCAIYDQELLALVRALEKWRPPYSYAHVTAYTARNILRS
ncbi:hypothetical protein Emed_003663 [Eimeria media]